MTKLISLNKFEFTIQTIIEVIKDLNSVENKLRKEEIVYVTEYNQLDFEEIKKELLKIQKLFMPGDKK
jgi:hypothetical protein